MDKQWQVNDPITLAQNVIMFFACLVAIYFSFGLTGIIFVVCLVISICAAISFSLGAWQQIEKKTTDDEFWR